MRFPSLDTLWLAARTSFARFPMVLLSAITAAVAAIVAVESDDADGWIKLYLAAQLGIPLFFAIDVGTEGRGWSRIRLAVTTGVAVIGLAGYALSLHMEYEQVLATRHAQLTAGTLLLVAFIPFSMGQRTNAFWQYNRSLFTRLCVAALYAAVLCGGLELALLGVDELLGVDVREELYMHLFITIGMVVTPWVFVGGVPRDIPALEANTEYPRGLKVFAQYILVPIVIIYLAILLIYLGKIIVTTVWPSGWIGWMVSIVAVVGIFAHLLVYPVRGREGNQWIGSYGRWYYAAMIPAAVMLVLAVGKRIDQYGITENRYVLAVLAVWLAGLSVYFLVRSSRNIKVIPITLCVIAFATSFGPWGAYSVSERSQLARLRAMLERNGILVDGTIVPATGETPFDDRREISAVLHYLTTNHGTDEIEAWFGERWAAIDSAGSVDAPRRRGAALSDPIMAAMGLTYVEHWRISEGAESFNYVLAPEALVFDLESADVMVRVGRGTRGVEVGSPSRTIGWNDDAQSFRITVDGDTLTVNMLEWLAGARSVLGDTYGTLTADMARAQAENARVRAVVYVQSVNCKLQGGAPSIAGMQVLCYLTWLD